MRKEILYLTIFILIFSNNTFAANNKAFFFDEANGVKFENHLNFSDIRLSDALALLSEMSDQTILASSETKNIEIDLYFSGNQTLKTIIISLMSAYNLDCKLVGNNLVLHKYEQINYEKVKTINMVGIISEKFTGKPIEGIQISLEGLAESNRITGAGGEFVYRNLEPGIYVISTKSEKYLNYAEVLTIEDREDHYIEIKLNKNDIISKEISDRKDEEITRIVSLVHISGEGIKKILTKSSSLDNIIINNEGKQVILIGNKKDIIEAENLIGKLDVNSKQVKILAEIWDINQDKAEKLGIEWSIQQAYNDTDNYEIDSGKSKSAYGNQGLGLELQLGNDSNVDVLNAALEILKSTNDASIIAKPKILAMSGEDATISVVDDEIVGQEEIKYEDGTIRYIPIYKKAGIVLEVTPFIQNDDRILIDLYTKVSEFTPSTSVGVAEKLSEARTRVKINDSETIIIGGLIRENKIDEIYGIPILSDLPFLGKIFQRKQSINNKREIVIKLTPKIIE